MITHQKAQHTPGKWITRTGSAHTAVYVEGTTYAVAVGCREADARLIASAPELLAALEALCGSAEADIYTDAEECAESVDDVWQKLAQARAAIAKAKGAA